MGQKWTVEEINLLEQVTKENKNWNDIIKFFPNRSKISLSNMAQRLKLQTSWNWTNEELFFLKENYNLFNNKEISKKLNRTKSAIDKKARELDLKKISLNQHLCKENLKILLEENIISYYYIGYLLADGNFSNGLSLEISIKDKDHLKEFVNYINYANKISERRNNCAIYISDRKNMNELKNKFDISNNKTINPPELDNYKNMDNNMLLSLIIGFIDGDGCIRKTTSKQKQICIEIHKSWFSFLNLILEKISLIKKVNSKVRINNRGYATLTICGNEIFNYLNKFIDENSLPVLKRKWEI